MIGFSWNAPRSSVSKDLQAELCLVASRCSKTMHKRIFAFSLLAVVTNAQQQPLEPLTKYRQTHRKTKDGRLCAAAYVHNSQAFTDCTSAPNPDGVTGTEWCFVEEQVASAGGASWGYCAPKVNYAEVRARVGAALEEKENELASAIQTVQGLSKDVTKLLSEIEAQCS